MLLLKSRMFECLIAVMLHASQLLQQSVHTYTCARVRDRRCAIKRETLLTSSTSGNNLSVVGHEFLQLGFILEPHLSDWSLCRRLTHSGSHSDVHGAGRSHGGSRRELSLRQELALVGRLAHHVSTAVTGHHALGLGHPRRRHSHLQKKRR